MRKVRGAQTRDGNARLQTETVSGNGGVSGERLWCEWSGEYEGERDRRRS